MSFARLSLRVTVLAVLAVLPMQTFAAAKLDLYNPKKSYGDEKKAIDDPASRCTGAAFQKLFNDAKAQAQKDIVKQQDKEGAVDTTTAEAFKTYVHDIALGWAAMQEPYCGFGAFGSSAAQKSFQKTINNARSAFLTSLKTVKLSGTKIKIQTVSAPDPAPATPTPSVPPSETASTTSVVAPVVPPTPVAAPTPVSSARPNRTSPLKRGMRSTQVRAWQEWLVSKGYLVADGATGYFGPMTEAAIKRFQKAQGIIQSDSSPGAGELGPKTQAALLK